MSDVFDEGNALVFHFEDIAAAVNRRPVKAKDAIDVAMDAVVDAFEDQAELKQANDKLKQEIAQRRAAEYDAYRNAANAQYQQMIGRQLALRYPRSKCRM